MDRNTDFLLLYFAVCVIFTVYLVRKWELKVEHGVKGIERIPEQENTKGKPPSSRSTTMTNTVVDETGETNSNSPSSPPPGCSLPIPSTASERMIRHPAGDGVVKLEDEPAAIDGEYDDTCIDDSGYLLMDTGIIFPILNELVKGSRCGFSVETDHMVDKKQGLAHFIKISCPSDSCLWNKSFYTSDKVKRDGRGADPFDVNLRVIMAFREIGKGHSGLETFCGYMNMPPPMAETTYNETVKFMLHPIYVVAAQNMKDAGKEIRREILDDYDENAVCDAAVSCDGSWQRRGYGSLNGLVTSINIDSGKCLSYQCLIKTCNAYELWSQRKGTIEYVNFIKEHDCPINHEDSAGSMEAVGVVKFFQKSLVDLQFRFTTYIGDGDSKAYSDVVKANPYGPEKPGMCPSCIETCWQSP